MHLSGEPPCPPSLPPAAFLVLRNLTPQLRTFSLGIFGWLGCITLETCARAGGLGRGWGGLPRWCACPREEATGPCSCGC